MNTFIGDVLTEFKFECIFGLFNYSKEFSNHTTPYQSIVKNYKELIICLSNDEITENNLIIYNKEGTKSYCLKKNDYIYISEGDNYVVLPGKLMKILKVKYDKIYYDSY
jgi:hypothetical protein